MNNRWLAKGHISNVFKFQFCLFQLYEVRNKLMGPPLKVFGCHVIWGLNNLNYFLGLWLILVFKILDFLEQHVWEPKFAFKDKLLLEWNSVCNYCGQG